MLKPKIENEALTSKTHDLWASRGRVRTASLLLGAVLASGVARQMLWAQSSYPPTAQAQAAASLPQLGAQTLQGSVAEGESSATPLSLTLDDAVHRALKNNLGVLLRDAGNESARAGRLRALSGLLPQVTGSLSENAAQTNLQALGINIPGAPKIVGPYGYTDVRAQAQQTLLDVTAWKNWQTARESVKASQLSLQDTRDLVVQAAASAYFQVIASAARVESLQAQVKTAQALFDRAGNQRKAGISAGIDVLRSQVELKSDEQQLVVQKNQQAKDKLALARVIGLPLGQVFELADKASFQTVSKLTPEEALQQAFAGRSDYQAQLALVRAAQSAKVAAKAEWLPALSVSGNYGDIGKTLGQSHGTFNVTGALKFNIFDGGRIQSDVLQADSGLRQRQFELADLRGRIDYEVRTALLDLSATAEQVSVAQENSELGRQTLEQARDRFGAGVSDSVEVVQAQQQSAAAEQNYISALFAHNLAKVAVARSLGQAEKNWKLWMDGTTAIPATTGGAKQ